MFCLTTDDFGTKYTRKEDVEHLLTTLRTKYEVTTNWEGTFYLGMTLKWDYNKVHTMQSVIKSMPGYVKIALLRFGHIARRIMHAASPYTAPTYGKHQQLAPTTDPTTFTPAQRKRLEEILGIFLYYGRAIDNTMLHALNDMASQIAMGNKKTNEAIECFLDYAATHPETEIKYVASDMVLQAESDAAYLVAPKARSRVGGYIYLGSKNRENAIINGPVLVIAKILKMVVSSAAEAKVATLFLNAQEMVPLRIACEEMGHPQPPSPIKCDNVTAQGIVNGTVKQKRSKTINVRFYWLKDRISQQQFVVY